MHTFRAACAAYRGDHHLVGEDHADFGGVIGNPVIADGMSLCVQRYSHAVGIIGTGIVIEDIFETEDGAIFLEAQFRSDVSGRVQRWLPGSSRAGLRAT